MEIFIVIYIHLRGLFMAIVDVVKYNGTPDVFAWKYPSEELGTWTQLIVNEAQEAVLFKSGVALDVFGSGRHTLDTDNIPILNNIINLPFGGRSPFAAEVWFINKVFSLDIKWGTATPIQIQDPKYGVFVPVRSFGQFGIRIDDSKKFLLKLVGTLSVFDTKNLVNFFRGLFITKSKDTLSSYIVHKQISVVEINAYLDEISGYMKERIEPILEEYGIKLVNFYVNDISVPEDDPAVKKLKEALAKRAEMNIIGYNYQQERTFDTLEGAAKNPSAGSAGFMGAGIGLGMGAGIGGSISGQFGDMAKQTVKLAETIECPHCHKQIDKVMHFCPECGFNIQPAAQNSDIVKCSSCGAVFSKKSKFCPECGNKYDACPKCGADVPQGAVKCDICGFVMPKLCPECGKPIENEKQKFCPECGAAFKKVTIQK
jgi:membrane protease subunit (stomatin/prohibitin family)